MRLRYHYCCDSVFTFLNWRLKKLSLDKNRIFRIPYLQQFQLRDGSGDWVGGRGSPQKEPHSMRQPKSWMFEASDEQPDYTVLPMKKDVDRTGEWCPLFQRLKPHGGNKLLTGYSESLWLPEALLRQSCGAWEGGGCPWIISVTS